MKRSRSLSLLLMGSILISAGCSEEKKPEQEVLSTFSSVQECVTSGIFTEQECKEFALSAVAQNPRFSTQAECEEQFGVGQCQSPATNTTASAAQSDGTQVQSQTGSMWMPMIMGFMAGRMLGGGGYMQGAQPLYRDPAAPNNAGTQNYRTARGDKVATDARGRVSNPTPNLKQSMSHVSKPAMSRAGSASSGGFKGGSGFSGAGS